jgi:hypothetical protein
MTASRQLSDPKEGVVDEETIKRFEEAPSGEPIRARVRNEIRELEKKIDAARSQVESGTGVAESTAEDLTGHILRLEGEKAQKEADLKALAAIDAPLLRDPQVHGWEATQGLVEYELVAGKDTLVRVFVGARAIALPADGAGFALPSSFHFTGADELVSRLDYASLEVKAPNGSRFRVPATMSGRFGLPGRSEEDNVNFYIAGDQLTRTGTYEFVARFYREGQLVGTNPLGTREFLETGDFRLLVKVNTFPMSDAGWDTLLMALQYLHRNLPVRAGVAPMDSDVSAGLRYYIDPRPYEPGFWEKPKWGNAKLALAVFNFTQHPFGHPFGNGDSAHMLMNVREQQPGQDYQPGSSEGPAADGGPSQICGVQIRTDPPGDGHFASVVGQEIGHNLIPLGGHTLDPVIQTSSAFDLLNRRAVPEARTVMFTTVAGDAFANDISFYEPQHWSSMRKNLIALNS